MCLQHATAIENPSKLNCLVNQVRANETDWNCVFKYSRFEE